MSELPFFLKKILHPSSRCDGTLVKIKDPVAALTPYIMKTRVEGAVYLRVEIDVTNAFALIEKLSREGVDIHLFHILMTAFLRVLVEKKKMNRFVVNKRLFQHNDLSQSFVIKKDFSEEGDESVAKIYFSPEDKLLEVSEKIISKVDRLRKEKKNESNVLFRLGAGSHLFLTLLEFSLRQLNKYGLLLKSYIELDPLFASVFVANLGSLRLSAPYHHLYEWGTVSTFIVIGKVRATPEGKKTVNLAVTLDERIGDGFYFASALNLLQEYVENPERLL